MLSRHALTFEQNGAIVRVDSKTPRDKKRSGAGTPSIRCSVTVPRQWNLDCRTAEVRSVTDLTGAVVPPDRRRIADGRPITGNVTATTSGGSIAIAGATGPVEADPGRQHPAWRNG
ncbi:MAG: hypothetical protein KIT22_05780 [Verrucomicrobiae bacterium]|nr:hypothetical protein [Verrucomicrobiae bacterium]